MDHVYVPESGGRMEYLYAEIKELRDELAKKDEEIRQLQDGLSRLMGVCAESYQVVGSLAGDLGVFGEPPITRALDNLSAGMRNVPIPHTDVLPFPSWPHGRMTGSGRSQSFTLELA